eukprot:5076969-Pleurochrysis_carterae.AAC.1
MAKGSRMLGGNTGYFAGKRDSLILGLTNKRFGSVWISANLSELDAVVQRRPAYDDVVGAFGEDYKVNAQRSQVPW